MNEFKREKVFNDLLIEMCETQIRYEFLEKANFVTSSKKTKLEEKLSIDSDQNDTEGYD